MITIYHWDLPQVLQDAGGWPNRLIVGWYAEYATLCFKLFGNRVKYWFTFNEPKQICHYGYGEPDTFKLAPGISVPQASYLCTHHVLLAHAEAWHIYQKYFKSSQKGNYNLLHFVGTDLKLVHCQFQDKLDLFLTLSVINQLQIRQRISEQQKLHINSR